MFGTDEYVTAADTVAAENATMATLAFSERDLAQGVTHWMIEHFHALLANAMRSTPFSLPLLCAIACREAGAYWLPLTANKTPAEVLSLCVYDASGDVEGAPRSAFPVNTAQFRLSYGEDFTSLLIGEANRARAARGLRAAAMVYKGYGIFQYDLQYVRSDEAFFRGRQWYDFGACVSRAVAELKKKYEATGDIQRAVRAYNGSGPRAEQYARDVMRLLPFCEQAARDDGAMVMSGIAAETSGAAPTVFALEYKAAAASADGAGDIDPAAPGFDEISETSDLATARVLANVGSPDTVEMFSPSATLAAPSLNFSIERASKFLHDCMTSSPRVTYGLGKKAPFLGAMPGRDFTRVDCSGFVREAVRLSTTPAARFPDGSVVQHDWIRDHGFARSTIAAARQHDDVVRIAFLRPQDSPSSIGHVVLIHRARTLESHGGTGPDARDWTGGGWQARAFVYELASGAQLALTASFEAITARRDAVSFTVRHGRRYRATIALGGFEQFASNDMVADKLAGVGFRDVHVTGGGTRRQAEATWGGPDTSAELDPHLSDVVEL